MQLGALPSTSLPTKPVDDAAARPAPTSTKQSSGFDSELQTRIRETDQTRSVVRTGTRQTVPIRRTQIDSTQARDALRAAWTQHFGEAPREETVAVLTAQWSHETGNGRSMLNFNFGGIKGTGPSGLTIAARTKEGWGASERTIVDNFRAYQSAEEGASDYLSLLRRKYPGAVEAAHQGDPEGFVRELKAGGYFTGNESAYIRSVSRRASQLLGHEPSKIEAQLPEGVLDVARPSPGPDAIASLRPAEPHSASRPSFAELQADLAQRHATEGGAVPSLASVAQRPLIPAALMGDPAGIAHLVDQQSLSDTLSRAALRIALSPDSKEEDA